MRKWLNILLIASLPACAQGDKKNLRRAVYSVTKPVSGDVKYHPAYQYYLNVADLQGFTHPSSSVKGVQNDLVVTLSNLGVLSNDTAVLYLTNTEFEGIHRLNLIDPARNILMPSDSGAVQFFPAKGIRSDGKFFYRTGLKYHLGNVDTYNNYSMGAYVNELCDTCGDYQNWYMGAGFFSIGRDRTTSNMGRQTFGDRLLGGIRWASNGANSYRFTNSGNASSFPRWLEITRTAIDTQRHYVDSVLGIERNEDVSVNGFGVGDTSYMTIMADLTTNEDGTQDAGLTQKDIIGLYYIGPALTAQQRAGISKAMKVYNDTMLQLVQTDTINPFWKDYAVEDDGIAALPYLPGRSASHGMETTGGTGRNLNNPAASAVIKTISTKDEWERLIDRYNPAAGEYGFLDSIRKIDVNNDTIPVLVLFDRSGTWEPDSNVHKTYLINKNYVTWAFCSAPAPGIQFNDYEIINNGSHQVLLHGKFNGGIDTVSGVPRDSMTWYAGKWSQYGERDVFKFGGDYLVFDHMTVTGSTDELLQTRGNNQTFSYNLYAYPYAYKFHHKGPHAKGTIHFNQSGDGTEGQKIAFYRNLYHTTVDRMPQIGGGVTGVLYDNFINNGKFGIQLLADNSHPMKISVKNLYASNFSRFPFRFLSSSDTTLGTRIYLENFQIKGQDSVITNPYAYSDIQPSIIAIPDSVAFGGNGFLNPDAAFKGTEPDSLPGYVFIPMDRLEKYLRERTGARTIEPGSTETLARLDILTNTVRNAPADDQDYFKVPQLPVFTASWTIPANPYAIQPSGYNNLEEWLHEMCAALEKPATE